MRVELKLCLIGLYAAYGCASYSHEVDRCFNYEIDRYESIQLKAEPVVGEKKEMVLAVWGMPRVTLLGKWGEGPFVCTTCMHRQLIPYHPSVTDPRESSWLYGTHFFVMKDDHCVEVGQLPFTGL